MDKTMEAHHEEVMSEKDPQTLYDGTGTLAADKEIESDYTVAYILKNHKKLCWWCFFWAMTAIGWGFDAQVNGAMISVPAFRRDFGYIFKGQPVLPAQWQTAFNVIGSPGQFVGGFLCSWIADRFGRKNSLLAGVILCCAGIVGQMVSDTRPGFLISKLFLGFGLGFYLTLGPLMTSEISPVVMRGITTAGVNLGIAIGQLLSNSVIAAFGGRTDHWSYRGPFAIQFFFALFLLCGYPFVPESPSYLVKKGRLQEATRSLQKLWGEKTDVSTKLAAIELTVAEEQSSGKASLLECFRGTNRQRTIISCGVFVCQHAVGIIFVLGFSGYFFQLAGLNVSKSFDLGVGVTACGVTGNLFSWLFINNAGRRRIFVYGMATLTIMLFVIGILDVIPTGAAKWVQAAITVVWAFVYFLTIGAMAFAILGETSSSSLRAPTVALATATQAIMGTAMNFAIPYMINPDQGNLRGKVGFVFGGLGLIGTVWSFFYVPELKGKTFAQIDMLFFKRVPPRKMGSYSL